MSGTPSVIRSSWWRWSVVVLLLLATTINYMDRVTLSSVSVRLSEAMQLSNRQYGDLELGFGWAFAAGSLAFGILADRMRVYLLYPAVIIGWSAAGLLTGFADSFDQLLTCRTLLGFFEAGHWPCALKLTFAVLSDRERTMGNSVLQSGASLGAILTPQVVRLLVTDEIGSWRLPFIVVGAFGLVWIALWFVIIRPRDLSGIDRAGAASPRGTLLRIMSGGRFWAVAILIVGAQTVWHVYRVWLMKFLQTGRGYPEAFALNFNSAYFAATDVGCLAAGGLSLWLCRKRGIDPHESRRTVYFCACLLTSLSLAIPWLGQGPFLLLILLLVGAGALALFPCYYSFVQDLSASHVGRLTGILGLWVWAVTSPMHSLFGFVVDRTGSYDVGLAIGGLAPWLGVISMHLLWKREHPPRPAQKAELPC